VAAAVLSIVRVLIVGIKIIADNRKARHDFSVIDTYEAGLELWGSEVKSLRDGQCNLKDSYISFRNNEAFLQSAHIAIYNPSSYNNHEPERLRKLLLHRHELDRLSAQMREKGYSLIPLKLYFKKGKVKLEIALAKGKTKGDKRQSIKSKDAKRQLDQAKRRSR